MPRAMIIEDVEDEEEKEKMEELRGIQAQVDIFKINKRILVVFGEKLQEMISQLQK